MAQGPKKEEDVAELAERIIKELRASRPQQKAEPSEENEKEASSDKEQV